MKQPVTWPGPTPGHATATFESRYFDPTQAYGGPWAWFRMIDEQRMGGRGRAAADRAESPEPLPQRAGDGRAGAGISEARSPRATGGNSVANRESADAGRLLRQAAEPRRFPAPARVGRVRRRVGRLAAGVPRRQPHGARRPLARRLPDEPGLALRLRGRRLRPGAGHRPDGAQRRSGRPLFSADARRRAAGRRRAW